jgi:hypothetical protein
MIPHRMFPSEFSNSGLRDRVTACRKRLRESRVMLRAPAAAGVEDLFSQSVGGRAPLTGRIGSRIEAEVGQHQEEISEEQEVGFP